jgi:hypothetical protein
VTPRSHLVRLGVMAASALLALGAVEVGLRAFNPQPDTAAAISSYPAAGFLRPLL